MATTLRIRHASVDAPRLDPARIGGISSAIALHIIALGLLMMPTRMPMQAPDIEQRTRFEPIARMPPPPPPPPPEEVEVVDRAPAPRQRTTPPATPLPPRAAQPSVSPAATDTTPDLPPALVDRGDALPPPGGASGGTDEGGGPVTGVALQYLTNPAPAYPREALRDGLEGTVLLRVLVDEEGRPVQVDVASGSGHRLLDRAAREQVLRRWRFVPARRDGRAVQAIGTVPVVFRIER